MTKEQQFLAAYGLFISSLIRECFSDDGKIDEQEKKALFSNAVLIYYAVKLLSDNHWDVKKARTSTITRIAEDAQDDVITRLANLEKIVNKFDDFFSSEEEKKIYCAYGFAIFIEIRNSFRDDNHIDSQEKQNIYLIIVGSFHALDILEECNYSVAKALQHDAILDPENDLIKRLLQNIHSHSQTIFS